MKNMKKKSIIIVIIILLVIGVLSILIHKNSKYIIPDNYIKKIEKNMSYLYGPDEDIYVYDDKIVVEENLYYPDGQYSYRHCKTITIYKGINDPEKIKEEKGKIVLKEFD